MDSSSSLVVILYLLLLAIQYPAPKFDHELRGGRLLVDLDYLDFTFCDLGARLQSPRGTSSCGRCAYRRTGTSGFAFNRMTPRWESGRSKEHASAQPAHHDCGVVIDGLHSSFIHPEYFVFQLDYDSFARSIPSFDT